MIVVLALGFCLLIAVLGGLGVVSPPRLLGLIRRFTTLEGFYIIAVLRMAFGAVLYLAAPTSRVPVLLQILGVVFIVAAVMTPFFGHGRYRELIDWWSAGGDIYVRVWAACTMVLALLLAYAVLPVATVASR